MPYVGQKPADIISTAVDTVTGTFSGEVDAASLDISGNIDVDGVTNLDVVDIDGAVDMASTLAVAGNATFIGDVKIGDSATDITSKLVVSGNADANVATFMYDGAAGTFLDFDLGAANGEVRLAADARSGSYPPMVFKTSATERMKIDATGAVTMPAQPAFYVETSSTQTDFAVSSTHTIAFGTERFDQNSDFASNVFTAPVTGKYFFNTTLRIESMDTAATYYLWGFDTSNHDYLSILMPRFSVDLSYISVNQSVVADMDAGDTAKVIFQQVGGTQQTDIQGAGGYSYFCGHLVA